MDVFNRCSLIQLNNRLRKEISRLLSKGMSNLKITIEKN